MWWVIAALLCIVIVFQVRSVWERYIVEREMHERREEAEMNLSDLEFRKQDLQTKVQYMTEERGVEEELRQNFDVALPGERVFILTGESDTQSEEVTSTASTTADTSPWYRFW